MGEAGAAPPLSAQDYEAIEAAVQETSRGRWFLAEFARRNRQADTLQVLDAIARLNAAFGERPAAPQAPPEIDPLLLSLARRVHRAREDVAASLGQGDIRPEPGSETLDVIAANALCANGAILRAAEHVQEIAWTLRETGTDGDLCEDLDRQATDIYAACTIHEATITRVRGLVESLRAIERSVAERLAADPADAGAPEPAAPEDDDVLPLTPDMRVGADVGGPASPERRGALVLDDDIVAVEAEQISIDAAPPPAFAAPGRQAHATSSFQAIDQMPLQEKLSSFV